MGSGLKARSDSSFQSVRSGPIGGGSAPPPKFFLTGAIFGAGTNIISLDFNLPITHMTMDGWSVTIDGGPETLLLDFFADVNAQVLTQVMGGAAIVLLSYDASQGNTVSNNSPLESFTDQKVTAMQGDLAFAAAGSLALFTDGASNSHLLQPISAGVGQAVFTHSGLSLPDHEGTLRAIKAGEPPWYGARMVDAGNGIWRAYDDDELGNPLPEQPWLYVAPNSQIRYDIGNHDNARGAYFLEWKPSFASSAITSALYMINVTNGAHMGVLGATSLNRVARQYDGVNLLEITEAVAADQIVKLASIYEAGVNKTINKDGVYAADGPYDGSFDSSVKIGIFDNTPGFSLVRNIRRYDQDYVTAKATIDGLMA